jgi:hypothetical protein
MHDRTLLVLELIRNPRAEDHIIQKLAELGEECEKQLAMVTRADFMAVLRQFEAGALSTSELTTWASRLEGRKDVGLEFGADGVVEEAICWLANPGIGGPIDLHLCQRIEMMFERRSVERRS